MCKKVKSLWNQLRVQNSVTVKSWLKNGSETQNLDFKSDQNLQTFLALPSKYGKI